MKFLKEKATTISGKEYVIGDHFSKGDFVQLNDSSSDAFVRHDPLLRVAKSIFGGIKNKTVNVIGVPSKSNEWSTTVCVKYEFSDGTTFESLAEARVSNVRNNMKAYTVTLAETRASSRALRFSLGLEVCSAEELVEIKNVDERNLEQEKITETQQAIIKRTVEKYQIPQDKLQEAIKKVSSKKLEEFSHSEAASLINNLQKRR